MDKSDQIDALAGALAKAQAEIRNAAKDSENPHFRSKYADLSSVWDACRGPLTKNGLAVIQMPHSLTDETGKVHLFVRTMLTHQSGQWIADTCEIPLTKIDAQGVVAAVTYGRRAGLAAFAGVAPGDDDDGETAVGRGKGAKAAPAPTTAPPAAPEPPKNDGTPTAMIQCALWEIAQKLGRDPEAIKAEGKAWLKAEHQLATKPQYAALSTETAGRICLELYSYFGADAPREPGSDE